MIPVVDSNFLQCEALGVYLAKSSQNFVVLTDYAFMEAYKADTIDTLYRSMDILSRYPKQVIVLKGTQVVCGLSGRNARLQRRLIDARATRGFSKFCSDLLTARHGNVAFQNELLHKARAARDQMHRIGIDAAQFGAALEGITSLFTHEERKVLRTGLPYTEAMGEKMISHVIMSAQSMFMRHPAVSKMPNGAEASNTYIFRMALCMHVWGHRWISVGGAGKTKVEKIRNDLIDVSFAAYATFFDGILTSDKRVKYIYGVAASLLKNVCVASAR